MPSWNSFYCEYDFFQTNKAMIFKISTISKDGMNEWIDERAEVKHAVWFPEKISAIRPASWNFTLLKKSLNSSWLKVCLLTKRWPSLTSETLRAPLPEDSHVSSSNGRGPSTSSSTESSSSSWGHTYCCLSSTDSYSIKIRERKSFIHIHKTLTSVPSRERNVCTEGDVARKRVRRRSQGAA